MNKLIKAPWRHDDEFRAINIFDAENRIIAILQCGLGDAVVGDDGKETCQGLSHIGVKANAELICKAVNNHDAMLEALKAAKSEFDDVLHNIEKGKVHFDGDDFHERLNKINEAIAKAAE